MVRLLHAACVIAALILSFVWLVSVAASGWNAPAWAGPAGLFAAALALTLALFLYPAPGGWPWARRPPP